MENIFEKLNLVSNVYDKKTENLGLLYRDQLCGQYYDLEHLTTIKEKSSEFNLININLINEAMKDLELQNKQAQRFSCVAIY